MVVTWKHVEKFKEYKYFGKVLNGKWSLRGQLEGKGILNGKILMAMHVPPQALKALCSQTGSGEVSDLFDIDLHNIKVRLITWISRPFVFLQLLQNCCSPLDKPNLKLETYHGSFRATSRFIYKLIIISQTSWMTDTHPGSTVKRATLTTSTGSQRE